MSNFLYPLYFSFIYADKINQRKSVSQNAVAGKKGSKIARDARLALERKTGRKVISGEKFLPLAKENKKIIWPEWQEQHSLFH